MIELKYESPLHAGQQECWSGFMDDDKIIEASVNCGRRWGKTTFGRRCALHWLINNPGCTVGYLAPETNNFVSVYRWFQDSLGDVVTKASSLPNYIIKLSNGSTLLFYSIKNHAAIRGQGFDYAIVDEFAHGLFSAPECIDSYGPTLAEAKKVLYISTPLGKNVHYRKHQQCYNVKHKFSYRAKTEDNPHIPRDFIEEKRIELPESRFDQEYGAEFLESGGEVFTGLDMVSTLTEYPGSVAGKRYYCGIDTGAKNDKSVLTIIDSEGVIAMIEHSYSDNYPDIIAEFSETLAQFNIVSGLIETNGIGQAMYDFLSKQFGQIQPFVMTNKSKGDIVQLTRSKIQQNLVQLPTRQLEPQLFNQMSDYQVSVSSSQLYTYSHPKGGHDDYVDSLMFAIKAAHEPYSPQFNATPRTTHRRMKMI